VEEDGPQIARGIVRLGHEAPVHVRVTAGLVHEQLAHLIEPFEREAALLEDRGALELRHTAGDDAEGLSGGVIVGGLDYEVA
jgi:hypothetical protein